MIHPPWSMVYGPWSINIPAGDAHVGRLYL